MLILIHPRMNPGWNHDIFLYLEPIRGWIPMNPISCNDPLGVAKQRWLVEITRWGVKDGDLTDGSTTRVTIWQCVKTLYPCSSHQNSWDLWMFIPLKMVLIGIDPYPYDVWLVWHLSPFDGLKESDAHHAWGISWHLQVPKVPPKVPRHCSMLGLSSKLAWAFCHRSRCFPPSNVSCFFYVCLSWNTRWGVKDGDLTDGSTIQYEWVAIWQCVKTLYPCSSHQNSW